MSSLEEKDIINTPPLIKPQAMQPPEPTQIESPPMPPGLTINKAENETKKVTHDNLSTVIIPVQAEEDGETEISFDPSSKPTIIDSQIIMNPPNPIEETVENNKPENETNKGLFIDKIQKYELQNEVWIGKISIPKEKSDKGKESKGDIKVTIKTNLDFKKEKFGQFWDRNAGIKIQGNFLNDKLEGLGLIIRDSGNGENDADFSFFRNGIKVEEVEDDESMFVYDMMYQVFKDNCKNAGVKYFSWIEGEEMEESQIMLRLSRTNFSRNGNETVELNNDKTEEIDIQDMGSYQTTNIPMGKIYESQLEDLEDSEPIAEKIKIVQSELFDSQQNETDGNPKIPSRDNLSKISKEVSGIPENEEEFIEDSQTLEAHKKIGSKTEPKEIKEVQDQHSKPRNEIVQDDEPIDVEDLGLVTEIDMDGKKNQNEDKGDKMAKSYEDYDYPTETHEPMSSTAEYHPATLRTESHATPYRKRSPLKSREQGENLCYITHYSPAGYKHEVYKQKNLHDGVSLDPKIDRNSRATSTTLEPRRGSKTRRNNSKSKSKDPVFKTFSPSKRILSDNQFITQHIDNVNTKPPRKHVFLASQNDSEHLDRDDPNLTLNDYETIMEREKHIKGYYRSYLERWGRKRKFRKPRRRNKNSKKSASKKYLKDYPEVKEKYEPTANSYQNEMMNIQDYPLNTSPPAVDDDNQFSRRDKNWMFNTNYQDMFNECVGDRTRGDSLERQAREAIEDTYRDTNNPSIAREGRMNTPER